jgi:hypothetical protein
MKLTNEQHEQLLAALDLFKQADAEDINTVIDAHDGEDERLSTVINLRKTLEQSIGRLDGDLINEITYYQEQAEGYEESGDKEKTAEFYRFALHSRATQYLAASQAEKTPYTQEELEKDVEKLIAEQGGSLDKEFKYLSAVDELIEVMHDR